MNPGIRSELRVPVAIGCPLARLSASGDVTAYSVSKSTAPGASGCVTEEFAVEECAGDDADVDVDVDGVDVETAFDSGSESIYRFERRAGQQCPCECVETHGYPVADVRGEQGTLYLVFHVPDQGALREVISTVSEHHPQVEVRSLVQSREDDATRSLVFFDKSLFTERQEEVLETAHRLGYFDHPKGANASEIAEALGITHATFVEHISAAQRKLLDSILDTE